MSTHAGPLHAHRTASNHVLSDAGWLDLHFEACRPEYELMLAAASFRPGARVLDAGCGNGAYVPLIQAYTGANGSVVAMDFDVANAVLTGRLMNVPALVGSVSALPFAGNSFDGVWCSNVAQFLDDAGFQACLHEFQRVLVPGGVVAIKDVDMTGTRFMPADPFLLAHLSEASYRLPDAPPETAGSLRGRELKHWLERAGFEQVEQRTHVIERWAPLTDLETEFYAQWLSYLAEIALERGVPAEDEVAWREVARDSGRPFVSRPDFYICEMQVVAQGAKPC
jgi:ubiquinone/menaquinone biosynthesis C-methylase UbiE